MRRGGGERERGEEALAVGAGEEGEHQQRVACGGERVDRGVGSCGAAERDEDDEGNDSSRIAA
jgi:hypothetical protein